VAGGCPHIFLKATPNTSRGAGCEKKSREEGEERMGDDEKKKFFFVWWGGCAKRVCSMCGVLWACGRLSFPLKMILVDLESENKYKI
jgi:hypothetical protein